MQKIRAHDHLHILLLVGAEHEARKHQHVDLSCPRACRAKFAGAFAAATLGHRHMHLLGPEYRLADAVTPGGLLLAESAKYVLQLKPEQADAFKVKMDELACSAGWRGADAKEVDGDGRLGRGAEAVLDGVVVYARK